jgi:hypothetical protein
MTTNTQHLYLLPRGDDPITNRSGSYLSHTATHSRDSSKSRGIQMSKAPRGVERKRTGWPPPRPRHPHSSPPPAASPLASAPSYPPPPCPPPPPPPRTRARAPGRMPRRLRCRTRPSRSRGRAGASSPASPASAPRTAPSPCSRRTDTSRPSSPRSRGRSPPSSCGASAYGPPTTAPSLSTGSAATTARYRGMRRCSYSWYGAPYPLASLRIASLDTLEVRQEPTTL